MSALDKADAVLNSEAADRLLEDVQQLAREIDERQNRIDEARREAGVKPGEPLLGIFKDVNLNKLGLQRGPQEVPHIEPRRPAPKVGTVPSGQETRVVDPTTGAAKGSKLARFDLIPSDVLDLLAKHYGRGARKYADRNWEGGYKWSLSYAAMQRHLSAFWQGDDVDPDPALYTVDDVFSEEEYANDPALHIVAALWHAVALTAFATRHIGTDDRPSVTRYPNADVGPGLRPHSNPESTHLDLD